MNIASVYVEITNRCNLNCASCYNSSGANKVINELSVQTLEKIITIFSEFGLRRLLLSGGEPTLHSEFTKILRLVDKYPHLSFGIVTNGTNPLPELIEYINTKDNVTLQISLDGSSEETNAQARGNGNFAKVIAFAKQITTKNPPPSLKMVLSQRNISDLQNFCTLALRLEFIPEISFLQKSGNSIISWDTQSLSPQQKLATLKFMNNFYVENNINTRLPICIISCPYINVEHNLSLSIKPSGNILPCQSLYDDAYSLSNIHTFTKDEFINNVNHFSKLASTRSNIDYGCTKCLIQEACQKGCIAEAVMLHANPFANDENCEFRKLQFLYHSLPDYFSHNE